MKTIFIILAATLLMMGCNKSETDDMTFDVLDGQSKGRYKCDSITISFYTRYRIENGLMIPHQAYTTLKRTPIVGCSNGEQDIFD